MNNIERKYHILTKMKKTLSLLLALVFMFTLLSGCDSSDSSESTETEETVESTSATTEETSQAEEITETTGEVEVTEPTEDVEATYFPPEEPETLTMLTSIYQGVLTYCEDWNGTFFWQELEARTNVHIEFTYTNNNDNLRSILFASGEFPDLISSMNTYSGGFSKAIEDELIFSLNDYLDDYMPNYNAVINSDEEYKLGTMLDDGTVPQAAVLGTLDSTSTMGFVMRGDWLDELGYDYSAVETYDDWYEILTAFKVQIGCESPLYIAKYGGVVASLLSTGYNYNVDCWNSSFLPISMEDGEIVCGLLQDDYIDYLNMVRTWYAEGLIDQDYASGGVILQDSGMIANGEYGCWVTYASWFHNYDEFVEGDDDFHLVPIQNPALYAGQEIHIGPSSSVVTFDGTSISTCCENIELACRWLDYFYGDEGHILANYGVEGVSFEIVDGEYVISDTVTNDPENLGWYKYTCYDKYPYVIEFTRKFGVYDEYQLASVDIWARADKDNVLPNGLALTAEEASEFSTLWGDIATFVNEFTNIYIMGQNDVSEFDGFIEQLKSMDIDRCMELYQQALDRYYARSL